MSITLSIPQSKHTKHVYTGHLCPCCQSKAVNYFILAKESKLDPRIRKVGACPNKNCVNSASYHHTHPNPPFSTKELRSKKKETIAGTTYITMEMEPKLHYQRVLNFKAECLAKLGHDNRRLACPVCQKWEIKIFDPPNGFFVQCQNCKFKVSG